MEKMSQNLEGLCDEWNLDFKQSFFIHLIVEELLLNIMKFGIGETDKKYYVSVKVMDNNGECILRIGIMSILTIPSTSAEMRLTVR